VILFLENRRRAITGVILILFICVFCCSPQFQSVYKMPPNMRVLEGEQTSFDVDFPLAVAVNQDNSDESMTRAHESLYSWSHPVNLQTVKLGQATIQFSLLGLIPLRTVHVDVLPTLKLIPGGHSIGVVLHSQGVIVVGHSPVLTADGKYETPAKDSGLLVGDVIVSLNGTPVQSDSQVAEMIDQSGKDGKSVDLLVKRGDSRIHLSVQSVLCADTKRYRIGLFVRDSAAGVGTLTYYDPVSKNYGALGHIITDNDTNQPIDCEQGKIVAATVSGIQQGRRGQPGEKIGVFIDEDKLLGTIQKNTNFGIDGTLAEDLGNPLYPEAIPVGSMSQVQLGSAEMLTVVDGQKIEKFSIEIQKINIQDVPEGKGLVIKVTDDRLLEKTGGIVQGMSGSPILQNGKIIGAVTHVFVHDPTKGYGCFIDWMLMEGGLIPKREQQTARRLFTRASDESQESDIEAA
jgi:stage IV sporulation protein B